MGTRTRSDTERSDAMNAGIQAGRPQLSGIFGAVSSTHWLPSAAAMSVLEKGGNAFDAAAAAGFVLQVVEPHYNGLGGDVPIVSYSASTGRVQVVCGQGPTPRAATIESITDLGLHQVPGSGLLPAVVPGAFGAWMRLLAEHGTLPLADILDPAIGYAEHGHPCWRAPPTPSRCWPRCSRPSGRSRRGSTSPADSRRPPVRGSATRCSRTPTSGCCGRRPPRRAGGRRRSPPPNGPSTGGSSRRRSTRTSPPPRSSTPPAAATRAC